MSYRLVSDLVMLAIFAAVVFRSRAELRQVLDMAKAKFARGGWERVAAVLLLVVLVSMHLMLLTGIFEERLRFIPWFTPAILLASSLVFILAYIWTRSHHETESSRDDERTSC